MTLIQKDRQSSLHTLRYDGMKLHKWISRCLGEHQRLGSRFNPSPHIRFAEELSKTGESALRCLSPHCTLAMARPT